jgi:Flavodoxins
MSDKIALIYASKSGRNEKVAQYLKQQFQQLGQPVELAEMAGFPVEHLADFAGIVLVSYTYYEGQLPDEAVAFFDELETVDLRGKYYALTGSSSIQHHYFGRALDLFDQKLAHLGANRATAVLKINLDSDRADLARLDAFCQQIIDFAQRTN